MLWRRDRTFLPLSKIKGLSAMPITPCSRTANVQRPYADADLARDNVDRGIRRQQVRPFRTAGKKIVGKARRWTTIMRLSYNDPELWRWIMSNFQDEISIQIRKLRGQIESFVSERVSPTLEKATTRLKATADTASRLDALIALLVSKGIITEEELKANEKVRGNAQSQAVQEMPGRSHLQGRTKSEHLSRRRRLLSLRGASHPTWSPVPATPSAGTFYASPNTLSIRRHPTTARPATAFT